MAAILSRAKCSAAEIRAPNSTAPHARLPAVALAAAQQRGELEFARGAS